MLSDFSLCENQINDQINEVRCAIRSNMSSIVCYEDIVYSTELQSVEGALFLRATDGHRFWHEAIEIIVLIC